MPTIAEFVGTLLSDVARARVVADVETLKIAQTYAGHTLLKHMPVPRFRLPDVTVEAPVLVDRIEPGPEGGPTPRPPWTPPTARELTRTIRRSLAESGVRPTPAERRRMYRSL